MDLYEYKWRFRKEYDLLPEKLDVTRAHLTSIAMGRSRPSKKLARKIEAHTNGAVTFAEVRPEIKDEVSPQG